MPNIKGKYTRIVLTFLLKCDKKTNIRIEYVQCYNAKVASYLMCKRESGENPERYRHCVWELLFRNHWETGKGETAMIEVRRTALA